MRRPTLRSLALLLALAPLPLAGCEGVAFLTKAVTGGDKIKPVYELQDRATLVMVDDPDNAFGNPTLPGVVASNIAHFLKENEVIATPFVSQRKLADVRDRLAQEYGKTPVDEIGRELGAEQVIWINIEQVALQPAPGFYRPTAKIELKVVDVKEGKRLYPEPPPIIEPGAPSRGRSMEVAFRYKGLEAESPGQDAMLARRLAERIGLEVAQLFYEHTRDAKFYEER